MRKCFWLVSLILFCLPCSAGAKEREIGVTLDLTYLSKWLSKGAEGYGQQAAFFKTIDIDWYGTGLGMKITHRNALSSGYVDKQRFDYRPYYKNQLFEGESYVTKYDLSVGYEHYTGLDRKKANTTFEWIFAFSWPDILPKGFVPSYIAHYEYPAGSGDTFNHITGWVHRFILGYDFKVPELSGQVFRLFSEVAYTDGLGGAEHDWSYFTMGLSTRYRINDNISLIPGVCHQFSMEDSVNTRDETYARLSMQYKF